MAGSFGGRVSETAQDSLWIKVCGTTNLEDAQLALDAGADALGFVFAPSPRQVAAAQVAAITAELPEGVERYGVFVEPDFERIAQTVQEAGLTGVQLHTPEDSGLPRRLQDHFASRLLFKVLRVVHHSPQVSDFQAELDRVAKIGGVDAVLVDSRTAQAVGGTGLRFDWVKARNVFSTIQPGRKLVLAGGLSPENIAEAISTLRPFGVDVVTGVERAPGRKSPEKVRDFISRARAAWLS